MTMWHQGVSRNEVYSFFSVIRENILKASLSAARRYSFVFLFTNLSLCFPLFTNNYLIAFFLIRKFLFPVLISSDYP